MRSVQWIAKLRLSGSWLAAAIALSAVATPLPASTLDQSFTGAGASPANGIINECCKYVAQTFTSGHTATLVSVRVNIADFRHVYPIRIAVHETLDGKPSGNVIGEATAGPGSLPLALDIPIPQQPALLQGVRYALVVSYVGAPPPGGGQGLGIWIGATGNAYPGGQHFLTLDGSTWISDNPDIDWHFQTYVDLPTPTASSTWGRVKSLYR